MRIRHVFAKVAGVSYPNDDGSERQTILARCHSGERLELVHDPNNRFSEYATKVLRHNRDQLGHAPEYLAERICDEVNSGYRASGVLLQITGGTFERPTRGANFAAIFMSRDVTDDELNSYALELISSTWDV